MDASKMTAEELMELAQEKAGASAPVDPGKKSITVDGHAIEYDEKKTVSWTALQHMRVIQDRESSDFDRLAGIVRLIEYATGISEAELAEMAGGEDAPWSDVAKLANDIIVAMFPKN